MEPPSNPRRQTVENHFNAAAALFNKPQIMASCAMNNNHRHFLSAPAHNSSLTQPD